MGVEEFNKKYSPGDVVNLTDKFGEIQRVVIETEARQFYYHGWKLVKIKGHGWHEIRTISSLNGLASKIQH